MSPRVQVEETVSVSKMDELLTLGNGMSESVNVVLNPFGLTVIPSWSLIYPSDNTRWDSPVFFKM